MLSSHPGPHTQDNNLEGPLQHMESLPPPTIILTALITSADIALVSLVSYIKTTDWCVYNTFSGEFEMFQRTSFLMIQINCIRNYRIFILFLIIIIVGNVCHLQNY